MEVAVAQNSGSQWLNTNSQRKSILNTNKQPEGNMDQNLDLWKIGYSHSKETARNDMFSIETAGLITHQHLRRSLKLEDSEKQQWCFMIPGDIIVPTGPGY